MCTRAWRCPGHLCLGWVTKPSFPWARASPRPLDGPQPTPETAARGTVCKTPQQLGHFYARRHFCTMSQEPRVGQLEEGMLGMDRECWVWTE